MSKATTSDWQTIQATVVQNLKTARHHLWGNNVVYLVLFLIEYYFATVSHSETLRADAFNNLSGILSSGLLIMGLFIAARTHDEDLMGAPISPAEQKSLGPRIQQSRFRFETIYTLIAGLLMISIAADIIFKGLQTLLTPHQLGIPSFAAAIGAGVSSLALLGLWGANHYWSRRLNNAALIAASRDTFSDALTSLVTVITIIGTTLLKVYWLDSIASILLGIYILNSGLKICHESSLNLVDYFDPYLEARYQARIETFKPVEGVQYLQAHYDGNLILLDVTIVVAPTMTATAIYALSQRINKVLWREFGVMQTDVLIVPHQKN